MNSFKVSSNDVRLMEAQAVHQFFLHLMAIFLTARLFGELFAHLKSPPVVGDLLAGVLLGPSGLA
ncbi:MULTISPECIES: hypothetical protein [Methylomonas]|nr:MULTISPECIES: hypothetical protein [Methylomonas]